MSFFTEDYLEGAGAIKREAKAQLSGNWKSMMLLSLVPTLFSIVVVWLFSGAFAVGFLGNQLQLVDPNQLTQNSGWEINLYVTTVNNGRLIQWAVQAFFALITVGIIYTMIDYIREDYQVRPLEDAFSAFTSGYGWKLFLVFLLKTVYTILWTFVLIIPGIIKGYSYSQAYNIYRDAQENGHDISVNDAITASREMMDGHKFDLFALQISFVGWYILSLFLLGIPLLWVIPYVNMSTAVFYENISTDYLAKKYNIHPHVSETI